MKELKTLLIAIVCFYSANAFGQQEPAITQFWSTYASTNPATTGLFYKHAANAHYRNQWDGVNGAPNTLNLNYGMRLEKIKSGVGIVYRHDAIGFNRQHKFLANYAYHLKLKETVLSFGVAGGVEFFRIKNDFFITPTPVDDPSIPTPSSKDAAFTSNIGIAFHSNVLNAGISCTQLNAPTFLLSGSTYSASRHYCMFLEHHHEFTDNLSIQPRIQIVADNVKSTYMASIMTVLYQKLWFGVNYSVDNYIGGMIGYDFYGRYRIGYGYDYTTNKLSNVSKGTHEIVLSYLIK
ncbi:MAG: PorP/SprF family type IX secretion system membrane protein [Fluviicola sp.]|nr:PorP/SprF family type IX secretion system membrane protein [Fluviicola sp.]